MDKVLSGEILEPGSDNASRQEKVRKNFWRTVKRAARQVPFMEEVVAGYFCAFDQQTPLKVRGILLAALAYFVMPLDAIPDFFAVVGFTDDIAILTAAIASVRAHITPAHHAAAKQALAEVERGDA